ncbi:MAG: CDF family Co(II)/Ni(II) efflux transporter DmeF [Betaproteobacteria bacterium]|nr:CDF family Co(II)/Ni(II) efflux transporter DmeF [Betaproteobacteria bacterium]
MSTASNIKRSILVLSISFTVMVVEILGGYAFNSMALLADGWHMGTHTIAIGITVLAYLYAKNKANDPSFAFGTWKVEILGAYTSALLLIFVGLTMGYESIERLFNPKTIDYGYAIATALIGLLVNALSALILGHHSHDHHHGHTHTVGHSHSHGHGRADDSDNKSPLETDLNLKAAYIHVITDAITSLLAIIALIAGLLFDWNWMDPLMGIVGSILVLLWSRSLIKQTTSILIDSGAQDETSETLRGKIKHLVTDISDIQDLRIWRTSNSHYACIIKIQGNADTNVRDHITLALSKLPISYAAIDIDEKVKHQKNSDLQNETRGNR